MRPRRPTTVYARLAAVTAIIVAATSCGEHLDAAHEPTQQATKHLAEQTLFAFTTPSSLSMVRDGVIASTVATTAAPRYPVFTESGNFVAATIDGRQVVAVGLSADSARTIVADTDRVFAGGRATIAWWESPTLVTLDLSDPSSMPAKKEVDLPGGTTDRTRLLSLANGVAVFAQPPADEAPDSAEELIMVDRDQSVHTLGPAPDKDVIRIAFPSSNGRKIAYEGMIRAACPKEAVDVLDTESGKMSSSKMPYSIDDKASARNIWWDTDQLLHMSLFQKPCAPTGDSRDTGSVATWKLDQGKWVQSDTPPVLVSRQLGEGITALVAPADPGSSTGPLWLVADEQRDQIADDVTDLATPPNAAGSR